MQIRDLKQCTCSLITWMSWWGNQYTVATAYIQLAYCNWFPGDKEKDSSEDPDFAVLHNIHGTFCSLPNSNTSKAVSAMQLHTLWSYYRLKLCNHPLKKRWLLLQMMLYMIYAVLWHRVAQNPNANPQILFSLLMLLDAYVYVDYRNPCRKANVLTAAFQPLDTCAYLGNVFFPRCRATKGTLLRPLHSL